MHRLRHAWKSGPVSDPTHVFVPTPAISLKKYTNDQDADTPDTRPQIDAGAGVVWRYVVTNTGDWPLTAVNLVGGIIIFRADDADEGRGGSGGARKDMSL